jgi:hypothetical protein
MGTPAVPSVRGSTGTVADYSDPMRSRLFGLVAAIGAALTSADRQIGAPARDIEECPLAWFDRYLVR